MSCVRACSSHFLSRCRLALAFEEKFVSLEEDKAREMEEEKKIFFSLSFESLFFEKGARM